MSNEFDKVESHAGPTLYRFTESDHEYAHEKGICIDGCPHCEKERERYNVGSQGCATIPPMFARMTPIEDSTLSKTLNQRGAEYGDYTHMAQIAQCIKDCMRLSANYGALSYVQRESLDVIATKIARIVCGNPNNPDSWLDIEGYAKLARDRVASPQGTGVPFSAPDAASHMRIDETP